jgi:TonB family protein
MKSMALFSAIPSQPQRRSPLTGSALAHGAILLLIIAACYQKPLARIVSPGEKSGNMATVLYSPADGYEAANGVTRAASGQPQPARAAAVKTSAAPMLAAGGPAAAESSSADAPPNADAANGLDSLGDGNVRIALGAYYPQPQPDLSPFPRGFEGDVVIDVLIDQTGKIRDKKLVRGISPQVDNTVMATLETWQFTPAERNGVAISSEQELLFHYGPV